MITQTQADRRYAWIIVGALLLLLMVVQGIVAAGIPTFDARIIADLGVTRGGLKFRDLVQIFSAGTAGICIGYLTVLIRPKHLILIGLSLLVICLYLYSKVTALWMIYAIHVVMGFCYSSAHVVIVVLIVKQWFPDRQAIPIGITLSGASLGSAIFPQIVVQLMQAFDWRTAMASLALFPLILLPLIAFVMKDAPGTAPKTAAATTAMADTPAETVPNWGTVIFLAIASFGIFYAAASFIFHTFLNLKDQNFSEQSAATGVSVIFFTGLAGKFISGFLAEKWGTRPVWLSHQLLMLLGALMITFAGIETVWAALFCLGFGWGGCFSLTQVMIAEQFSNRLLGRMTGWFIAFEGLGSGSGSWLTGVMFDHFGAYRVPFLICDALLVASIGATLLLRRNERAAARALA
jgi:MFS family permease